METRANFVLHLKELDQATWVGLFAFIPRIEGKTSFGRVHEPPPKNGIKQLAFYAPDEVVFDFVDFFNQHKLNVILIGALGMIIRMCIQILILISIVWTFMIFLGY